MKTTIVCARCGTEVIFTGVTEGYYAVCPTHDEDLDKWETEVVPKDESIVPCCECGEVGIPYRDHPFKEWICDPCEIKLGYSI